MKIEVEEFNTQETVTAGGHWLLNPVRKMNVIHFALSTLQRHTGGVEVLFHSFLILTLDEGGLNVTPRSL